MKRAVQQIMLGTVTRSEKETLQTLQTIKNAGYDGIELNGFMIRPTPFLVRVLTKAAGMPAGKGGSYDWPGLLKESGLVVTSIHEDLGSIEREPEKIIEEARLFGTDNIVVTGMYRFDYRQPENIHSLCQRLTTAGQILHDGGISLLYHNHNIEWCHCNGKPAYDLILEETDPAAVNFEFDSYWPAEAGVDVLGVMKKLGSRMKLYHINDRGTKLTKTPLTPILKSDSMELGTGTMNLPALIDQAKSAGTEAIILESHKNWIDNNPIASLTVSGEYLSRVM